jgi:hypothetical protein
VDATDLHRHQRLPQALAPDCRLQQKPATLLAPFSYLQIVAATLLGWLVFDQLPGPITATGIALICLAGLGVALVEVRMAFVRSRTALLNKSEITAHASVGSQTQDDTGPSAPGSAD